MISGLTIYQRAGNPDTLLSATSGNWGGAVKGFIDFIRKGNLVQLAVAFVMGVAFAAVVTSFVNDIITPLLGLVGGADFSDEIYCMTGDCDAGTGVALRWGAFLTAIITFLVTALAIYFVVVKPYTALEERLKRNKDEDVAPTEVDLLTEIRDELKASNRD